MTMFRKVFTDRVTQTGSGSPEDENITMIPHPEMADADEAPPADQSPLQTLFSGASVVEDLSAAPAAMAPPPRIPTPAPDPTPDVVAETARPTSRPRTRLLGFGPGVIDDPIAAGEQTAPTGRHPAGWLVIVAGPGEGFHFPVTAGVASIGRGADQDISLDFGDTAISRSGHASVAYDTGDNNCYLGHGGKANIIRLNDRPVLTTEQLSDGDVICIGETKLRFVALCGVDFRWGTTADV